MNRQNQKTTRQPKKRGATGTGEAVQLDAAKTERAKRTATVFLTVGIDESEVVDGEMAAIELMDGSIVLTWCGQVTKHKNGKLTAEFDAVNEDISHWIGKVVSVRQN